MEIKIRLATLEETLFEMLPKEHEERSEVLGKMTQEHIVNLSQAINTIYKKFKRPKT